MTGKAKLEQLFATPFFSVQLAEVHSLNQALVRDVLELSSTTPSTVQSNVGGWQSSKSLQDSPVQSFAELIAIINDAVMQFFSIATDGKILASPKQIRLWANVNRAGDFNGPHYHAGAVLSGVYYPEGGQSDAGPADVGTLILKDPSRSSVIASALPLPDPLRSIFPHQIVIEPAASLLVLFPSWLEHWVAPHTSGKPRISLAFDVIY